MVGRMYRGEEREQDSGTMDGGLKNDDREDDSQNESRAA